MAWNIGQFLSVFSIYVSVCVLYLATLSVCSLSSCSTTMSERAHMTKVIYSSLIHHMSVFDIQLVCVNTSTSKTDSFPSSYSIVYYSWNLTGAISSSIFRLTLKEGKQARFRTSVLNPFHLWPEGQNLLTITRTSSNDRTMVKQTIRR